MLWFFPIATFGCQWVSGWVTATLEFGHKEWPVRLETLQTFDIVMSSQGSFAQLRCFPIARVPAESKGQLLSSPPRQPGDMDWLWRAERRTIYKKEAKYRMCCKSGGIFTHQSDIKSPQNYHRRRQGKGNSWIAFNMTFENWISWLITLGLLVCSLGF